jgi:hypothetical protein
VCSGKDATEFFTELHRPEILDEIAAEYKVGVLAMTADNNGGGGGATAAGGDRPVVGSGGSLTGGGSSAAAEVVDGDSFTMAEVAANASKAWVVLHGSVVTTTRNQSQCSSALLYFIGVSVNF